jgi:hypothetical protein
MIIALTRGRFRRNGADRTPPRIVAATFLQGRRGSVM